MNIKKDFNNEPKQDFSDMIISETLSTRIDTDEEVFEAYSNLLWKGFFEIKNKILNVPKLDKNQATISGINLMDNLFWFIYNYSYNLHLTVYLTERGKLLFTEFLVMSRTHQLMKQIEKYPTIQDAFQFAIKRSIGSLSCSGKQKKLPSYSLNISEMRSLYRNIFRTIEYKIDNGEINPQLIEYCVETLQPIMLRNFDNNIIYLKNFINSNRICLLNINGYIFFLRLLVYRNLQPYDFLEEFIRIYLNIYKSELNEVTFSEMENKAHYLLIQWENDLFTHK